MRIGRAAQAIAGAAMATQTTHEGSPTGETRTLHPFLHRLVTYCTDEPNLTAHTIGDRDNEHTVPYFRKDDQGNRLDSGRRDDGPDSTVRGLLVVAAGHA